MRLQSYCCLWLLFGELCTAGTFGCSCALETGSNHSVLKSSIVPENIVIHEILALEIANSFANTMASAGQVFAKELFEKKTPIASGKSAMQPIKDAYKGRGASDIGGLSRAELRVVLCLLSIEIDRIPQSWQLEGDFLMYFLEATRAKFLEGAHPKLEDFFSGYQSDSLAEATDAFRAAVHSKTAKAVDKDRMIASGDREAPEDLKSDFRNYLRDFVQHFLITYGRNFLCRGLEPDPCIEK